MTNVFAWLRDRAAAFLAKPAATVINIHTQAQERGATQGPKPSYEPMTCAEAAAQQDIEIGDEVRLHSADVWMTVVYADCVEADCAWFSGADLQTETFPFAALTSAPPMPF